MSRIARIVAKDYPHHLIQRGNNKQSIFFNDEDRSLYLYLLKKYSKENKCKICAYCLMDNHVHLLAVPFQDDSLAKTMQKVSLVYTQQFNKKYKRTGRLWECRFHSTVVDKDSYLLTVCKYIECNPVRAKMVNIPTDYKWSSAKINIIGQKDNFNFVEPIWQDYIQKQDYVEFVRLDSNIDDDIKIIRKATLTGKPLGDEKFINYLFDKLGLSINIRAKGRPRKIKK